ncbi:hypothetical protein BYT27DRAFT_7249710 [Phlegmacium glaucopus]|nr:hypothetical protein BYT27DRAFT_7249710 [Phlegmacium glaucopus]
MSSTASPSPTASSGEGDLDTQRGANYFFGFLIAFVGIIMILFVCGIGSRWRVASRREGVTNFRPFRSISNDKSEGPPQFYECPFVIGEDKWSNLMPLSASICKNEENGSDLFAHDLEELPPAPRSTRCLTCHVFPSFFLPNWSCIHHKNPQTRHDPDPPETIQIAIMIVMPYKPQNHDQPPKKLDHLPESQIGDISLPWRQHDLRLVS